MPRIFVSYRRSDSSGSARLLADRLAERFGESNVFRDVRGIDAGDDFPAEIRDNLERTTVVVAVIGPGWHGSRGWWRRSRIRSKNDWVRRELEIAAESRVVIVPVLVQGAAPLRAASLPPSLAYLATLHAPILRADRWDDDLTALLDELAGGHEKAPADLDGMVERRRDRTAAALHRARLRSASLIMLLAALVVAVAVFQWRSPPTVGAVLVDASPASDAAVDIGFWNLRWFTTRGFAREPLDAERVSRVAQAVVDLDLDLIGLLELEAPRVPSDGEKSALELLVAELAHLGHQVGYEVEATSGPMDLAVLYRRDRIQCTREEEVYAAHGARLRQEDPSTGGAAFPRNPLFVSCSAARVAPIFITLVHFKSMFGGAVETRSRRQLASIIVGEIVAGRSRAIVGGDFNALPAEVVEVFGGLSDVGGLIRRFRPEAEPATWIGMPGQEAPLDYIWTSPSLPIRPVNGGAYAVVALDRDDPSYVDRVSDHRPLVISVPYDE